MMNGTDLSNTPGVTVRERAGGTLHAANAQWAKRPADETFMSIAAFRDDMSRRRKASMGATIRYADLTVDVKGEEITLAGKSGHPALLTNWAFGQVAARSGAPASYLRTLPPALAAECLRTSLYGARDTDDEAGVLLRREDNAVRIHAFTGAKYARVWNYELGDLVLDLQAAQPSWTNPEAFRTALGVSANAWGDTKVLPCAFGGDRDCFIFLVDYDRPISVPGQDHPLVRGFFLENSEVGGGSIRLTTFLFDFACSNMLVWGAQEVQEISMSHVGTVRDRFFKGTSRTPAPAQLLAEYARSSAQSIESGIVSAQRRIVGNTVEEAQQAILAKRIPGITKGHVSAAVEVANANPRYGNPLSVWGIVNGLTEVSQRTAYAGDRTALDRSIGKLMMVNF